MRKHSLTSRLYTYGIGGVLCLLILYLAGFAIFTLAVTREPSSTPPSLSGSFDIVVFTGGKNRVKTALNLLEQNPSARLLISGVSTRTGLHQLLYSTENSTFPTKLYTHITLGRRALSTTGNAEETADWAKHNHSHALLIVTSSYHMPRALTELRIAEPNLQLIPYKVHSSDPDLFFSQTGLKILCREYIKFTGVILRNVL